MLRVVAPAILQGLHLIGRHGTWLLYAGVFIGLVLPEAANAMRPLLTPCLALLLFFSFLRVNWQTAYAYVRRPGLALLALIWLLFVTPLLVWLALQPFDLPPGLIGGLVMMAAAPPILGSTAIAILLGLDDALTMLSSVAATFIAPFTIPPLVLLLLGLDLEIGLWQFMYRLMLLVFGALTAAWAVRCLLGRERLQRSAKEIDGVNVVLLVALAVAVMAGVTDTLIQQPNIVFLWLIAAFVANTALQAVSTLAFAWLSRRQALTMGLAAGNRNMILLLATLPAGAGPLPNESAFGIMLFFALAQFPMYTLPALQRPLYRRLLRDT